MRVSTGYEGGVAPYRRPCRRYKWFILVISVIFFAMTSIPISYLMLQTTEVESNYNNTVIVEYDVELDSRPRLALETIGWNATPKAQKVKDWLENGRLRNVSRDKGIILPLHERMISMGMSLIRQLRCLGNEEVIQVYHCTSKELSAPSRNALFALDPRLEIIDVCQELRNKDQISNNMAQTFRNWWIKPLALTHTDLQHPILLDADVIPVKDPAVVRETPAYQSTGTLFFYDRVTGPHEFLSTRAGWTREPWVRKFLRDFPYDRFGIKAGRLPNHVLNSYVYSGASGHEQDSSMVAVDKTRAGKAMQVLWYFITELRFQEKKWHGDKESFWLSYALARVPYTFSPWGTSVVSCSICEDMTLHPDTLCGSLAHYVPAGSLDEPAELLYVNGKALLEPFPVKIGQYKRAAQLHNPAISHIAARRPRVSPQFQWIDYGTECMVGVDATPLPDAFQKHLLLRRVFYNAVKLGNINALGQCYRL